MEKDVDIKSPFTGGRVKEVSTIEEKEFRKEKYSVHVRYYVCEDTGEQFTTTEQDTLLFNDLYSQYRVRHGIPFPDEIKALRQKYNLNYSQITKILGFGANQYARYEAGEIPSESNGKMIATIRDKRVILELLKSCRAVFPTNEYQRIMTSILLSDDAKENNPLSRVIYPDTKRSIFNGYGTPNLTKLFEVVRYIVNRHGEVFPTKLNKLLFYTDFCNYRQSGQSISCLQYRALNFGPVPDHYGTIFDNTPNLEKRLIEAHGIVSTLFSCTQEVEEKELTEGEKRVIDYVVSKLKPLSVTKIIEESHKEEAWKNNREAHRLIPYDEAFSLKLV